MSEMKLKLNEEKVNNEDNWQILIVDDDLTIHTMTNLVLKRLTFCGKGLNIINAHSAKEAKEILSTRENIAAAIIDVVMETSDAGLKLVEYIREELKNHDIRLIIRTGQPGDEPEQSILKGYDINDYCLKTDMTSDKLHAVIYFALRGFNTISKYKMREVSLEQQLDKMVMKNDMRAQLIKNVSHEIRTPLNSISSAISLLKEHNLSDESKSLIDIIEKCTDSLTPLVADILDYSRLETGQMTLKESPFNLKEELELLFHTYTIQNKKDGLEIVFNVDSEVPEYLVGDFPRLKQVVVNLINNALKFTSQGQVLLSVKVNEVRNGSNHLYFEISDTGIGIPDDIKELIFNPFVQYNSDSNIGTGLGLAISRDIVNAMGGTLSLESTVGEGSKFYFGLNFQSKEEEPLLIERALIIDDDPIALKSMKKVLEKMVREVKTCNKICEVDEYEGKDFQVVLIDLDINGEKSFDLIERFSKTSATVFILSGYSDLEMKEKCLSMGADYYMVKPFDVNMFLSMLR